MTQTAVYDFARQWIVPHQWSLVILFLVCFGMSELVRREKIGKTWMVVATYVAFTVLFVALYPKTLEVCGIEDFGQGMWTEAEIRESHANRWLFPALTIKRMCEPWVNPLVLNIVYGMSLLLFPALIAYGVHVGLNKNKDLQKRI